MRPLKRCLGSHYLGPRSCQRAPDAMRAPEAIVLGDWWTVGRLNPAA